MSAVVPLKSNSQIHTFFGFVVHHHYAIFLSMILNTLIHIQNFICEVYLSSKCFNTLSS